MAVRARSADPAERSGAGPEVLGRSSAVMGG
ncbi:MAG: hypothetical protein QOI25_3013, partial [Mycobacterium sp.]|nr:hypothetical protein [Mycobacterium sp.]